jgi:hypothetical protein
VPAVLVLAGVLAVLDGTLAVVGWTLAVVDWLVTGVDCSVIAELEEKELPGREVTPVGSATCTSG